MMKPDTSKIDWAIPRQATPLGYPLPLDEHACSVSLPTWQSVVGYEEGWKSVTSQLKCGYPRFVYHPYVIQLMDRALELDQALQEKQKELIRRDASSSRHPNSYDTTALPSDKTWDCIVLPSRDSAIRCHDFLIKACGFCSGLASSPRFAKNYQGSIITNIDLFCPDNALDWVTDPPLPSSQQQRQASESAHYDNCVSSVDPWYNANAPIRMLNLNAAGTFAIIFPAQTAFALEAKSYWQHSGEIVSSRRAECALIELNQQLNEKNGATSPLSSLNRFTSCYYDNANPQSCSNTDNMQWTSCSSDPNRKYIAHHPSIIPCDDKEKDISDYYNHIRNHIADVTFTSPSCVFLTPSGMASIYTAIRSARRRKLLVDRLEDGQNNTESNSVRKRITSGNGGTAIVYGFPYLDTLKMCSRTEWVPGGVEFFGFADDQDLDQLSRWLNHRRRSSIAQLGGGSSTNGDAGVSVLVTEYPSNPLLNCPDLKALRALADEHDFALVVDDTIGNFANLDLLSSGLADAVCTSLTKLFSGRGDVIAGSIVTNPNTVTGRWMQQDLMKSENRIKGRKEIETMLFLGDAAALKANSKDFLERSDKINQTAEAFADWLKERDEIAKVYYPKYSCEDKYLQVLNRHALPIPANGHGSKNLRFHKAGYGGLMSIILQPNICQRTFYDSLNLSKGPSLGTNFTLLCPYTLLAHYHELDFAMSYNVEPNLLRISVGLEELDELKEKFSFAFQSSRLYPKVPPLKNSVGSNEKGNHRRSYTTWSDCRLVQDFSSKRSFQRSDLRTDRPVVMKTLDLNGLAQYGGSRCNASKRILGRSFIRTLRLLH